METLMRDMWASRSTEAAFDAVDRFRSNRTDETKAEALRCIDRCVETLRALEPTAETDRYAEWAEAMRELDVLREIVGRADAR